jgi:hypothetical protein
MKPNQIKMQRTNGTKATTDVENSRIMFKHFEKTVNRHDLSAWEQEALDSVKQQPTNDLLEASPTRKEIKAALRKMKREKSP